MSGRPITTLTRTRAQQLKALGNRVVPQQAALAVRTLLMRGAVGA
jgi:hypothetical protein